jgi:hypothetical protein
LPPAQLALSVEMRSDRPVIVLRQVSGPTCDVGTLQITTRVRDQRGEAVLVQDFRSAFTGEISHAVDFISGFVYTPLCNQRGPLVATVTAGEITASQTLPVRNCLSPTPTSGERESPPRCDAQQLALAIGRVFHHQLPLSSYVTFGESPASWVCGSICAFSLSTESQLRFSHSMAQAGSGARSSRVRPFLPVLAFFRGADSGGRSSPSSPQVYTKRGVHSPIHALARRTNEKRTDWRNACGRAAAG